MNLLSRIVLFKDERSKKQKCIRYKIVIRFKYFCFFFSSSFPNPEDATDKRWFQIVSIMREQRFSQRYWWILKSPVTWSVVRQVFADDSGAVPFFETSGITLKTTQSHISKDLNIWCMCFHTFVLTSEVRKNINIYRVLDNQQAQLF